MFCTVGWGKKSKDVTLENLHSFTNLLLEKIIAGLLTV